METIYKKLKKTNKANILKVLQPPVIPVSAAGETGL